MPTWTILGYFMPFVQIGDGGSASSPAVRIDGTNRGFYSSASTSVSLALNGAEKYRFHQSTMSTAPTISPLAGGTPLTLKGTDTDAADAVSVKSDTNGEFTEIQSLIHGFYNNGVFMAGVSSEGIGNFTNGNSTMLSNDNVSNPPTDAELDSAFGDPSTLPSSFIGVLDDNGAGTNVYFCMTTGTEWWYISATKAI